MTITNIISAIGNNSSIYPLLFRDCCIEAPSKILIARQENMKESKEIANDATREKFIDEYFTSAIWLGGIPLTEVVCDKYISKKGFSPLVNLKLFKEEQNGKNVLQGIEYNINKFKNFKEKDVQAAVQDLIKIKNNKSAYEKLLTKKFFAATIIPTAIMGFILPPLNFALTRKLRRDKAAASNALQKAANPATSFTALQVDEFKRRITNSNSSNPSFTGGFVSTVANLRTIDKMAISDGGLTVGRVSTSRNKEEGYMNAFRMIGSMILNFVTPVYIAKALDKSANKVFGVNVNLDPKVLGNEEFIKAIKENKVELPKTDSAADLFEFIDTKPKSFFSRFAQESGKISYLDSGIRDPRKYVDVKDLAKFKKEFENFINSANASKSIENFAKKAKYVKCINILANVGISSFLLAGVLPKLQYEFNKLVTGSYLDPGLK